MFNRNDPSFAFIKQKLLWVRSIWSKAVNLKLAIAGFDNEHEQLFWRQRQNESITTLKSTLILGAVGFLIFILLDLINHNLHYGGFIGRLSIVLSFGLLFIFLQKTTPAKIKIPQITKLGIGSYLLNLIVIMLTDRQSLFFTEIWTGLLPIYFFIYGQLLISFAETVLFGWLLMLILPVSAYGLGVSVNQLIPSILILLITNLFGFFTRFQLEKHIRLAYIAKCRAEKAAQEKTAFLQQLSHNLRQPLQALSSNSTLLDTVSRDYPDSRLQHIAGRVGNTTDELINTFNHIMTLGNLENGKELPLLKPIDINLILSAMLDQFSEQANNRQLKLKILLRKQPPYTVMSDDCILRQIISNLIDNAVKYTNRGWIFVSVVKVNAHQLKLSVRDSGIGISEHDQPKIFAEYYRVTRRFADPRGSGIGLNYVHKALKILPGHSLTVFSKVNVGSNFQLRLPVADQACLTGVVPVVRAVCNCFAFIVDDNPELLSLLAEQLREKGCMVQSAIGKEEAVLQLKDNQIPPDILITDFYLRNQETAHDVITAVHELCGSIPVLILSAHTVSDEDKNKLPANTILLRKPANNTLLFEKIAEAIAKNTHLNLNNRQQA